jgi:hypothetical protein
MRCLLLLAVITTFCSCNKIIDIIKGNSGGSTTCQILTLTDQIVSPGGSVDRIATCKYNSFGNPTSVTYNRRETGFSWSFFTYDKFQRLVEFKDENNATYRYVYNGYDSQPVRDTFTTTFLSTFVEYFTYDNKGRITNVKGKFLKSDAGDVSDNYEENYVYDAKGNLTGSSNYDNKVSVYRTSFVWMFLFRNYSVNNLITAKSYNTQGLPLDFRNSPGPSQRFSKGFLTVR